jgi:predicted ArsR family transcriptional regulator
MIPNDRTFSLIAFLQKRTGHPSLSALSKETAISLNSLRKHLDYLAKEGFIEIFEMALPFNNTSKNSKLTQEGFDLAEKINKGLVKL